MILYLSAADKKTIEEDLKQIWSKTFPKRKNEDKCENVEEDIEPIRVVKQNLLL